jgi:hypothetical protein
MGGYKFKHISQTVTVPANSYLELDFSSYGAYPSVVAAYLGNYMLPYSENGAVKTWLYKITTNGIVRIQNNTSEWSNYILTCILAVR